ncbi:PadR family transcriptional regulator [Solibacillus sp. FSL K6-1781]|uniref:PadR family transcriptional regulator n=1 Tax=Solibacillus sp. FSL K6-1781 TaxID=2921474 RepID=UPI00315A8E98
MIKLLVLELLNRRPMSGYEMKQILENTDAKRWSGVLPGSIYNAIKKLEKEGYIIISSIEMTGNRQRSEFKITQKGKDYQQSLIKDALSSPVLYNGDLYSGIGFAYQLDHQSAISILQNNMSALNKEKKEIIAGKKQKEIATNGELSELSSIVINHMIKTIELQSQLIESVIGVIKKENNSD